VSTRQKWVGTAALGLHLFLILAVSVQDISSTLAGAPSLLPTSFEPFLERIETVASTVMGKRLAASNPVRQALATYADGTGIEAGYSYFAPNVPGNSKLAFELHYSDGRVEYDLPAVGGEAAGYRVATLLDRLHAFHYARLRQALVKTLVFSIRQEHPDAVMIRAVFGVANLTSATEYRMGKRTSYEALYAYDFHFQPKTSQPSAR
jgi:hypothetical protein